MGAKHTPGPWMWRTSNVVLVGLDLDQPIKAKGVAQMLGYREEAEANARLIAAAPELLGALEGCVQHLEWSNGPGRSAYRRAQEVIAKATGEQA